MNDKNFDKDFLSIKEFSKFAGMAISAVRYYDNIGVFSPVKYGNANEHNYRYYSPRQITTVKMIRVLKQIGVPLKIIKDLSRNRTPERMIKLLNKYKNMLAEEKHFLQEVHSIIETFIDLLIEGISATENELSIYEMPKRKIILGGVNDFNGSAGFYKEFSRFCETTHTAKLNLSYPIGGYFDNMASFMSAPSQPTRFFSFDPKGYECKEAGLYLIGYNRGYYGQTNDLPERMTTYAKKQGLKFTGPVYNVYLFDEISIADPNQYLLQVSASVSETRRAAFRRPRHRFQL